MRELSQLLAEVIQAHRRRAPNASRARLLTHQTFLYALIVPLPIIKRQLVKLRAPAPVPRAGLGPRAHVPNVRVALMPRLPAKLRAARALREQPITLPAAQLRVQLVRQAQLLRQRALLSAPTATRALMLSQQAFLYALIVPLPVIKR